MNGETRTLERLRSHYEIEKELANRLRNSTRGERQSLYTSLYNELFRRVPDHPQLTRKHSQQEIQKRITDQMKFIKPFLGKNDTFMEIGAGDCTFTIEVARFVNKVYAIDVSDELTRNLCKPDNLYFIMSDGTTIPVTQSSVNIAYSNQLMEHLHPDDALEQLKNTYNSLVSGGMYICITPSKLSGPHDISKYFDKVATGFHLKEYTNYELSKLFKEVGFHKIRVYPRIDKRYVGLPVLPLFLMELFLDNIPHKFARSIANKTPYKSWLGVKMVGIKN